MTAASATDWLRRLPELGVSAIEAAQARPARSRIGPGRLAAIALHGVDDPPQFEALVDELVKRVVPVSLDRVADAQAGGAPLPARAALLTFDDGHPSVLDHGLPTLAARRVPAVVYVIADLIGSDTPFWWDEIAALVAAGGQLEGGPVDSAGQLVNRLKEVPDAERLAVLEQLRSSAGGPAPVARQLGADDLATLEAGGIAIGSHTASHPILVACDDDKIEAEVAGSRTTLTTLLGRPPRSIAYPSGRVDDRVVAAVERAGYELGFGWEHRVASSPAPDRFRIPRMHASAGSSRGRFVLLAEGRHRSLPR